jgi:hypothetical protein
VTAAIAISLGNSLVGIRSSSMTTEVSTYPLAIRDSTTKRGVLIKHGLQVGPQPFGIQRCRLGEYRQHRIP